ncbi:MAG: hypothetical protein ACOCV3_08245 [Halanaerobiales bacterium]
MKYFYLSLLLVLFLLVVPVLAVNVVQANDTLAQEKIEVNVKIPVMQKVEVIDPIEITQEELNEVAETGQALVKENVGELRIISNTDWELQIQDQFNSDFQIYVRLSNDRQAEWINLADTDNNFFTGEQGRENISFDLKVETVSQEGLADYSAEDSEMQLSYVLSG